MECVAPTGDCAEALGRFKGPLRRSTNLFVAPLIRPARFRGSPSTGATLTGATVRGAPESTESGVTYAVLSPSDDYRRRFVDESRTYIQLFVHSL